jgi:8-oxo-dGTP diphosphatase
MTEYVAGFLFSPDEKEVLLIHKKRPVWQAGKLNGIGGHIELGETPLEAMRREFLEETGLDIPAWVHCVDLYGNDWLVHFFYTCGYLYYAKSMTDEEVFPFPVENLPENIIPNLKYLIPLCLDKDLVKPFRLNERMAK